MALVERHLRSSANYIWNTSVILGKGATGSVYQGNNKHTGEAVAVKSFNSMSLGRPSEVRSREYEVLSKVNHENIVKLLAIEEELERRESHQKVLVMELCTGGSLFNILDDPANSFGLEETEFLLVLEHLAAGMKHLRDMNIIHRDLKPGNIMKFITEDGRSIYKLTDFGAARELEEDQQFMSLYGTEEYLHPELYARAVLKKPAAKSFSAKVDLWSIGVTLFHIATGSLPFRPYGGRKNKEVMHRITTEKQQGIISGIQHSDHGDIEWSENLPRTCLLSPALQRKITPLLAGLLEYNPMKMWTFDQFFQSVTHILAEKPVYIFYVNNLCDFTLYTKANERISELKSRLASQDYAHVAMLNQLMMCNRRKLNDEDRIPFTSPDDPIILIDSEATSLKSDHLMTGNQFKFPELLNPLSKTHTGEQDAQHSKACASIAYCIKRNVAKSALFSNVMRHIPEELLSLIETNIDSLNERRETCSQFISSMKDQIEYICGTRVNLRKCIDKLSETTSDVASSEMNEIRASFSDNLEKAWRELLPKIVDINKRVSSLKKRWLTEPLKSDNEIKQARCRTEYLCARIKESWTFFQKNKSIRSLGSNETQLQHLEKVRIDANCKKLLIILYEDIQPALNRLAERLDDWYNDAHVALIQSACLVDELSRLINNRERVVGLLNIAVENQHQDWIMLTNQLTARASRLELSFDTENKMNRELTSDHGNENPPIQPLASTDYRKPKLDQLYTTGLNSLNSAIETSGICKHDPANLIEEILSLKEAQSRLCSSLSENQQLFSELVSITISAKNIDHDQF